MVSHKILVIDDIPIVSQATALMLKSIGYEVDQAVSGAAAIELFKTTEYAAIITDFNMPKMNGFECTAKIRELEKSTGSRIPIICMSTGNDAGMKERCLAADLDDYLDKDCSLAELTATLLHWVE
jgi:CheY-like chemotaxis protein